MSPLPREVQQALLKVARRAIADAVFYEHLPEVPPPDVFPQLEVSIEPCGVFVSLHRAGHLRGCIGNIECKGPLALSVASCAVSAALHDPRFSPVAQQEYAELQIEISLLSTPQPIKPMAIEVGRHGLIVKHGNRRALLLPQVASERGWTRECFLAETCRKASLDPDAWKNSDAQIFAFETEIFRESDFEEPSVKSRD
jgi:uncharacterized protein